MLNVVEGQWQILCREEVVLSCECDGTIVDSKVHQKQFSRQM